jgi:FlaG/FlaF family flagellin (archaellin)
MKMKKNFKKNKTGLSPVITTVLLIALVIVIIGVIFLWFSGMVEEGVTKFGKNIQLVCDDVSFDASYSSGTLNIVNNGNVPLYNLNLKISNAGAYTTKSITDLNAGSSWPKNGLNQGGTFSGNIQSDVGNADTITVFPILIGTSTSGKKTFVCEGQYGKALSTS